jgi:hypothetical protein
MIGIAVCSGITLFGCADRPATGHVAVALTASGAAGKPPPAGG